MNYLSAGHHFNPEGNDPGPMSNGWVEAKLTRELRDLVHADLLSISDNVVVDKDTETLSQYLKRIKPGSGSVVCELHFNSSIRMATGIEVIVKDDATDVERKLANEICNLGATYLGLFVRGVKSESQSHRGRLAILHTKAVISVLPEICFINNPDDMARYQKHKGVFAMKLAKLLARYDELYS